MQWIILTGLVSVQKHALMLDMGTAFRAQGQAVHLVDNIARMPLTDAPALPVTRLSGDIIDHLDTLLTLEADVVIIGAYESTDLDALMLAIMDLTDAHPALTVLQVALIDADLCNCLPLTREKLIDYADIRVNLPYDKDNVLQSVMRAIEERPKQAP